MMQTKEIEIENREIDRETKWAIVLSISAIVMGVALAIIFSVLKIPV